MPSTEQRSKILLAVFLMCCLESNVMEFLVLCCKNEQSALVILGYEYRQRYPWILEHL